MILSKKVFFSVLFCYSFTLSRRYKTKLKKILKNIEKYEAFINATAVGLIPIHSDKKTLRHATHNTQQHATIQKLAKSGEQ